MIKSIPKSDITVRPFPTYKSWNFTVENQKPFIMLVQTDADQEHPDYSSDYGLLYNHYVVQDGRGLTYGDWRVPSQADFNTLGTTDNRTLRSTNISTQDPAFRATPPHPRWNFSSLDHLGTDVFNFSALPSGRRGSAATTGQQSQTLGNEFLAWTTTATGGSFWTRRITSSANNTTYQAWGTGTGIAVRLVRNATWAEELLDDGTFVDDYIGNDGKEYPAVKIGSLVWVAKNLHETEFANGDPIPIVGEDLSEYDNQGQNDQWTAYANANTPAASVYRLRFLTAPPYRFSYIPSPRNTFEIERRFGTDGEYTVDWGDGVIEEGIADRNKLHTYTDPGTYTVKLTGNVQNLSFGSQALFKLKEIQQWGDVEWDLFDWAFRQLYNVDVTATDIPKFSENADPDLLFFEAFRESIGIKGNSSINNWTKNVGDGFLTTWGGRFIFAGCFNFDVALPDWDFSTGHPWAYAGLITRTGLSIENFDETLIGWAESTEVNNGPYDVITGTETLWYSPAAKAAHDKLVYDFNWQLLYTLEDGLDYDEIYGSLYNWFAAVDERGMANTGSDDWRVPSRDDWIDLRAYIMNEYSVPFGEVGNMLKSRRQIKSGFGSPYDTTDHPRFHQHGSESGSDDFNFSSLPAGLRDTSGFHNGVVNRPGDFFTCGLRGNYWSTEVNFADNIFYAEISYDFGNLAIGSAYKMWWGASVRLVRNATPTEETELNDGDILENEYVGNDGRAYDAVKIGSQIWIRENLRETQYANGDEIPFVDDNDAWSTLITGARCVYRRNRDDE